MMSVTIPPGASFENAELDSSAYTSRVVRVRQLSPSGQDLRQGGAAVGAHVQDDEDRGREIARQIADEAGQWLDPARRGSDDDDVLARHPPFPRD